MLTSSSLNIPVLPSKILITMSSPWWTGSHNAKLIREFIKSAPIKHDKMTFQKQMIEQTVHVTGGEKT